jgi:starvation-inducible DNA-binding protein
MCANHLGSPEIAGTDTTTSLKARLADALDLAALIKQAYWTLRDSSSSGRRELFEACHDEMDECIDSLARRIAALSGVAECSVRTTALNSSTRKRYAQRTRRGEQHETAIRMVLARFGRAVRDDIDQAAEVGDAGTVNVLSDVSRKVDTQLWVAEAQLI